jgi:hypothetical protein
MYVCVLSTSPRKYASHCKVQLARLPLEEGYDPNYNANLGPGFKWHAQPSPHAIGFSGRPGKLPLRKPIRSFRRAAANWTQPNGQSNNLAALFPYVFRLDLDESVISNCPRCPSETIALLEGTANWRGEKDVMARKKMSWHEWRPM